MIDGDRGQAHTLEAIVASIILLSSLTFALQVTAVTPLSASTASQHIENQQKSVADGVLAVTERDGSLKESVLFWDTSNQKFWTASNAYYVNRAPPNRFGDALSMAYRGSGIAYNVYVSYQTAAGGGSWVTQRMLYRGRPSDNAITASRTVTLYDSDCLVDSNGLRTTNCFDDGSTPDDFYAPEISSSTGVYNVVRVEVVVWRM